MSVVETSESLTCVFQVEDTKLIAISYTYLKTQTHANKPQNTLRLQSSAFKTLKI